VFVTSYGTYTKNLNSSTVVYMACRIRHSANSEAIQPFFYCTANCGFKQMNQRDYIMQTEALRLLTTPCSKNHVCRAKFASSLCKKANWHLLHCIFSMLRVFIFYPQHAPLLALCKSPRTLSPAFALQNNDIHAGALPYEPQKKLVYLTQTFLLQSA